MSETKTPPVGATPQGSSPLPAIVAGVLTLAVAFMALALAMQAKSNAPTWEAFSASGPGRPIDVSKSGHLSDWLFDVTTYGITFLFIIMVGILLWACLNHREGHKAHYEHGIGRHHLILTAVISSAIFFGIDGTLLYNAYADLHSDFYNYPTATEEPLTVEVMAQQWVWNFRYPGPDKKFNTADDIVTINDMHIPVGKPVLIRLQSKDVIHSFYLPNFRTKQDAIPGSTTRLWFQATQPGSFDIGCAQHCGAYHYKMRGSLTVDTPEHYADWEKGMVAEAQRNYDEKDPEAHWGWDWEY
jgi:cytochrome c oxidase subunit 2